MQFLEECARQEAKRWIRRRVEIGQSAEEIGRDFCGSRNGHLDIQIGGWAFHDGKGQSVKHGHVAVFKIGGVPCIYQFDIAELHRDIARPEEVGVQVSLF